MRVVVAGAPPPSKTIERVETELGWEFIQIYGLTETAPLLTINRAPAEWDGLDAAARSLLLSRAGAPARSACASPSTTRARSWPGPTTSSPATGSSPTRRRRRSRAGGSTRATAATSTDAYPVISDRKKDVIITGGENVSSIEVEDCLYQHAAVAEVAVIGVPDEKWGETVKALVVVREGSRSPRPSSSSTAAPAWPTSRRHQRRAPRRPRRTATGKLQKYKLREPYWEGRDRSIG